MPDGTIMAGAKHKSGKKSKVAKPGVKKAMMKKMSKKTY